MSLSDAHTVLKYVRQNWSVPVISDNIVTKDAVRCEERS